MAKRASRTTIYNGFTIVELLIVVVVIAILAAITIVSYNGISNRAKSSAVQATTKQAYNKILAFAADNADSYPAALSTINVSNAGATTYQYYVNNGITPRKFCVASLQAGMSFFMSNTQGAPQSGDCYSQNLVNTSINSWESGQYSNTTGAPISDPQRIRHLDFIAVEQGISYTGSTNATDFNLIIRFYDANKNFISSAGGIPNGSSFTTPNGSAYISVSMYNIVSANPSFSTYVTNFNSNYIIPSIVRTP